MNHLNIFNPFKNKPNYHEDELTRAFLILIKNIPLVQAVFIEMVRSEMINQKCEQIIPHLLEKESLIESVETQVTNNNDLFKTILGRRVVSIVISDDKLYDDIKIESSERGARYDGLILYQPSWILIIENKPSIENIWIEQLKPNVSDEFEIEEKPISLSWRNIVEALSSLIERNMVHGADKILIDDFLEFVDNEYPRLNPYTHFSVCKDNEYLLTKRCIAIMEQIGLGKVEYHRGWKHYIAYETDAIKKIALSVSFSGDEWSVMLEMMPGDTMNQARSFYTHLQKSKIEDLINAGWKIQPNMHFAFRATNLVWTDVKIEIMEYVDYWIKNLPNLGQVNRSDFHEYCKNLEQAGIISPDNWDDINTKIINTSMQKINICPGVYFSYSWKKKEAEELDKGDTFINIVRQKIDEAKEIWEPESNRS
jgi:hypothetical protein